jgi:hypothetical protein
MALFGYPQAQENDAERAVRAAVAIQRALAEARPMRELGSKEPIGLRPVHRAVSDHSVSYPQALK